jgi:hypothetical protein
MKLCHIKEMEAEDQQAREKALPQCADCAHFEFHGFPILGVPLAEGWCNKLNKVVKESAYCDSWAATK